MLASFLFKSFPCTYNPYSGSSMQPLRLEVGYFFTLPRFRKIINICISSNRKAE
jgi:hypothetical protein